MNRTTLLPLAALLAMSGANAAYASCEIESVRQALPVRQSAIAPLAASLQAAPTLPNLMPSVFAPASSEALALERVLLRQRLSGCVVDEFAGYAPRTEFDNTPWRFNAGGEGKKFDADEFESWMKKRGVRIARGRGEVQVEVEVVTPAPVVAEPASGQPIAK